ncbi:hypothetical protein M011DRAFT_73743 [Sporormia fimetaria CBS 119925]|uniref:Uncharacterized protein n=1 Tax=Sporormia fimetaria CBS 119925 TaxID=1340428 RepID=A0A6A6VBA7_9PLEO|nr:hypothetical protein M011DRAFT_73743 [Sporormia fimetaria CBS 119925]
MHKITLQAIICNGASSLKITANDLKAYLHSFSLVEGPRQVERIPSEYPATVISMIGWAFSFGLHEEAVQLVIAVLPDVPTPVSLSWEDWLDALRFVNQLLDLIIPYQVDRLEARVGAFVRQVLERSASKLMDCRPQDPSDWSRPSPTCDCSYCLPLCAFLRSPTEVESKFLHPQNVLNHLQQQLHVDGDYEVETDLLSQPFDTLVIKKTTRPYHLQKQQWEKKVDDMKSVLRGLRGESSNSGTRREYLKRLLGSDYARLASMTHIIVPKLQPSASTAQQVSETASNVQAPSASQSQTVQTFPATGAPSDSMQPPPVAGVKRKAEEITDSTEGPSDADSTNVQGTTHPNAGTIGLSKMQKDTKGLQEHPG